MGRLADVGAPEPGVFGVGSFAGERATAPELVDGGHGGPVPKDGGGPARGKDGGGGHLGGGPARNPGV